MSVTMKWCAGSARPGKSRLLHSSSRSTSPGLQPLARSVAPTNPGGCLVGVPRALVQRGSRPDFPVRRRVRPRPRAGARSDRGVPGPDVAGGLAPGLRPLAQLLARCHRRVRELKDQRCAAPATIWGCPALGGTSFSCSLSRILQLVSSSFCFLSALSAPTTRCSVRLFCGTGNCNQD